MSFAELLNPDEVELQDHYPNAAEHAADGIVHAIGVVLALIGGGALFAAAMVHGGATIAGAVALQIPPDRVADLAAPPEAFLGQRVAEVLPADVALETEATIACVLASGGTETIEYTLELGGSSRDFEARLGPVGPDEVVACVSQGQQSILAHLSS